MRTSRHVHADEGILRRRLPRRHRRKDLAPIFKRLAHHREPSGRRDRDPIRIVQLARAFARLEGVQTPLVERLAAGIKHLETMVLEFRDV